MRPVFGQPVFVLGSHVRHAAVFARDLGADHYGFGRWVPLCGQQRPANDANGTRWPIAATPAENARPVCAYCVRKITRLAEVLR